MIDEAGSKSGVMVTEETTKAAAGAAAAPQPAKTIPSKIVTSRGLWTWLSQLNSSIAFSSYQTGQLYMLGTMPNGKLSIVHRTFPRAMGISAASNRIFLGTHYQIWRFENVLGPKELANKVHDRAFVPRVGYTTGDVDIHELTTEEGQGTGRLVFVNTKYSCLATTSASHSFTAIWKPKFISRLAPEDRCHLNGLAKREGRVRYVTATSRSDMISGWRDRKHEGGIIIDITDDRVITEKLSMPHSPRYHEGQLYVLNSGDGHICRVDEQTGEVEKLAFCPGFLRGMSLYKNYAIVGVSLPRESSFSGLQLDDELKRRDGEPWCGVLIVDLKNGDIKHWLRFDEGVRELFDVAFIGGVKCPLLLSARASEIDKMITFEETYQTV